MKLIIDIPKDALKEMKTEELISIESLDTAIECIKNGTPLDDVKAENKGEWKRISPTGIYECSHCGQNVMTSDIKCYKFCHGCGARM